MVLPHWQPHYLPPGLTHLLELKGVALPPRVQNQRDTSRPRRPPLSRLRRRRPLCLALIRLSTPLTAPANPTPLHLRLVARTLFCCLCSCAAHARCWPLLFFSFALFAIVRSAHISVLSRTARGCVSCIYPGVLHLINPSPFCVSLFTAVSQRPGWRCTSP